MITKDRFGYEPTEHETEKASNSYVMSLVAIIGGLPLPIINLFASAVFYMANRKGTYYVRWHCMQALFSQLVLLPFNSVGFWWTMSILFSPEKISSNYVAYIITLFLFNFSEFLATIHSAIVTRKGAHVEWWVIGELTNQLCRPGDFSKKYF